MPIVSPALSVVIPTFNRLSHLQACLQSLESQTLPSEHFEAIVVVDGDVDGSAQWLGDYQPSFRLHRLVQENAGLCVARNRGNHAARGEVILSLDDDMVAAPGLLAAHLHTHRDFPNHWIQGAILLHETIPRAPFVHYRERRLRRFHQTQSQSGAALDFRDVSGGNFSLPRTLFERVGGFDPGLRRLSDTDGELAFRLRRLGVGFRYQPQALAFATHMKGLAASLDESSLYGRTYVYIQRRIPEAIWPLSPLIRDRASLLRNAMRRFLFARSAGGAKEGWGPPPWPLGALDGALQTLIPLLERLRWAAAAGTCYRLALDLHFWRGVFEESSGRIGPFQPRSTPILCYHQVSRQRPRAFRPYILKPRTFERQMRWLDQKGYRCVSLRALCDYLERGAPLPEKAVAITFDDGYRDLQETTVPLLAKMGFSHTLFLNAGKLGQTSDWVTKAPDIPLLSRQEVAALALRWSPWVDIQAHGMTHARLDWLDDDALSREVGGCIDVLRPLAPGPVDQLAYAYGAYRADTPDKAAALGLRAAFTVDRGLCRPGQDMFRLPRVEVFSRDLFVDFICKVIWGRSPLAELRGWLKAGAVKVIRRIRKIQNSTDSE